MQALYVIRPSPGLDGKGEARGEALLKSQLLSLLLCVYRSLFSWSAVGRDQLQNTGVPHLSVQHHICICSMLSD